MPYQFRQETRAVIRRRIGYLLKREKFVYGTVASVPTATSFVLAEAKIRQDDALVGCVAYVVSGTDAGSAYVISDNAQGTGVVTTSVSHGLDATSVVEIWFDSLAPEQVNNAINQAINDAQDQAVVKAVQSNPTLDADRKVVTPPATFTRVYALAWRDGSGRWTRARAVNQPDDLAWVDSGQYRFAILDGALRLNAAIPSDIAGADIHLLGYRLPDLLDDDADTAEVRSDYLTYKAGVILESSKIENPQFDPEGHGQRVNVWVREVARCYPTLNTEWEPNTVDL